MRLSYVPKPPICETEEDKAILQRIEARRSPDGLWKLDLTLLHSPQIADAFNTFVGAIRTKTSLPADLREAAFLRVAAISNCWYEWDIHTPFARRAEISDDAIQSILNGDIRSKWLSDEQKAVLEYADAVSAPGCPVVDAQVAKLREFLDERQVVDMTACVAGFNLVARLVSALDVGEKNGASQKSSS